MQTTGEESSMAVAMPVTMLVAPGPLVVKLRFAERVIDRKNGAARIAKNVFYAEMLQRLAEDFCAGKFHSVLPDCTGCEYVCGKTVTAPREADETRNAYLAMTPLVKRGAGGFQLARRCLICSTVNSTLRVRLGMSKTMMSRSAIAAIGPPCAASGATCPAIKPCVAPLKRPSVSRATESPSPAPTRAAVTASISRMPGPPFGPS